MSVKLTHRQRHAPAAIADATVKINRPPQERRSRTGEI